MAFSEDRENFVYIAKLAEQAECYNGRMYTRSSQRFCYKINFITLLKKSGNCLIFEYDCKKDEDIEDNDDY
ncbi:unnamed protein product [Amaranthus hypochondriacus]